MPRLLGVFPAEASMAQSAARGFHNPKVVSSSLTDRIFSVFFCKKIPSGRNRTSDPVITAEVLQSHALPIELQKVRWNGHNRK
ncbi:hypothetical protein TcBrA4_0122260 [Trypanosoma cruzi]|nr:hypothetical protein TcBrA4_0122260 [Trypanosoma cruzi]